MLFKDNYVYLKNGQIVKFPFFIITEEKNIPFLKNMQIRKLQGNENGNILAFTDNKFTYFQILQRLRKNNCLYWKPVSDIAMFRIITQKQYPIYPKNHEELSTLSLDIETTGLDSNVDKITLIITKHSENGLKIFKGKNEYRLLKEFINYLQKCDYDVLIGHNIVTFDLPFIHSRLRLHELKYTFGKEKGEIYISKHTSTFPYRYGRFVYNKVFVQNVDIADTQFMVMAYDMIKRECDNYKLKYLEEFFEIVDTTKRVYLSPEEIITAKGNDKRLIEYCKQDVLSTEKLYEMFIPSYYYQLDYFPMSLQDIIFSTIIPKWDSLIVFEYLKNKHSIPLRERDDIEDGIKFEGAITGCLKTGVIKNVRKIDVSSLYPSIIIKHHIKSDKDYLDVAYQRFVQITKDRLWYKQRKKENKIYDYIQNALKYIINPYFGYLGNEYSMFSNLEGAAKITEYGRHYITKILEEMEKLGVEIIEIDTDGVIYAGEKIADKINKTLPKEIQVEDEGFWTQMISYSKKNYILYNSKRDWVKKGVFFRSSSMVKLKKQFVDDFINCIFEKENLFELLDRYYIKITTGKCSIDELKQKFRVKETIEEYLESLKNNPNKNKQLPYEWFIRHKIKPKSEEIVFLYKKFTGKKFETMEHEKDFDGIYDIKYYTKMLFDFIEKIYKNARNILPDYFTDEDYVKYRFLFTGVKTKLKKKTS